MAGTHSAPIYRKLAIGVFGLSGLAVAIALLTPAPALPEVDVWDKLEHAGAFAGLAFLGLLAFPERGRAWPLALGLIAFGAVCESLQAFVPGRDASLPDIVANSIGVLAAIGLWKLRYQAMGSAGGS